VLKYQSQLGLALKVGKEGDSRPRGVTREFNHHGVSITPISTGAPRGSLCLVRQVVRACILYSSESVVYNIKHLVRVGYKG
jgi:hypothetical protein